MLFSSIPFLYFFLPIVLVLYLITPKRLKNTVLLLSDLVFYAWGEQLLVLLFVGSILAGWILGLCIEKTKGKKFSRIFLLLSVLESLGILFYFKYTDFFIANWNSLTGASIPLLKTALPIGISFYTFQILSYTMDVYRSSVPAQKNLIDFALYVSLFPQLIAGPIVRYKDVEKQLSHHPMTLDSASEGIRRFVLGLGKKILLANVLGELCILFRQTQAPSVLYCWMYATAFMLQIYFDFSGYSDMAIGLGRIFGFSFMENFRFPYTSSSITEFWRRWHISLGSWFRDYVYIPLGGNRKGSIRQLLNILIVWLLTGFWHGAAWNFILWGLFYAVLLLLEKLWLLKYLERSRILGHIYVLFAVLLGFVLFGASSLSEAVRDIRGMFGAAGLPLVSAESLYYLRSYGFVMILAVIGCTPYPQRIFGILEKKHTVSAFLNILEPELLICLFIIATAYLADGSFNPFLYFRF